jgi:uncharacterized membrane protein
VPRKSKKPQAESPAGQPVSDALDEPRIDNKLVAEILDTFKDAAPSLTTGDHLPRQLPTAEPELLPLPRAEQAPADRELIVPETNPDRHRPTPLRNGEEKPPESFAEMVIARRKPMQAVPAGFHNVASYPEAGIRVNKSSDKKTAAIQFSEDRLPDRAEKDILEALGQAADQKFDYIARKRQWERQAPEAYGANIIDAVRVAEELAAGRKERGR